MNNTKPRREAAVLVFVVFILGGLLGAYGNHLWGQRVWSKSPGHGAVAELTRQLDLTADQQKQLGGIMDDTRGQLRTLYASANAQCRAIYSPLDPQHEQIRERGRDRIRGILTAEQRTKFDAFMQEVDEQHKKTGGR